MKRLLLVLLVGFILIGMASPVLAANLLLNGGFEQVFYGWHDLWGIPANLDTVHYSGTYSSYKFVSFPNPGTDY